MLNVIILQCNCLTPPVHCCYTGHPYWDVKVTAVAPKIPLTSIHVTLVRGFLGATGLSHLGPNVNTFRIAITFSTSTDVCVNRLPLASRTKVHWSGTSTSSQRQENFFSITSFAFDERKYIYIYESFVDVWCFLQVVLRYDIILIQEIRSKNEGPINELLADVNK